VADQKRIMQAIQDNQLLNRLLPKIIDRIDVKLVLTQRPGQIGSVRSGELSVGSPSVSAQARCLPGETAVSGGIDHELIGSTNPYIWKFAREKNVPNVWTFLTVFDGTGGKLYSYAECLKVELSLKGAQQPQPQQPTQPQPPAQPPGGPPLQPPPEFGSK
jgi:hypothetical protein